MTAFPNGTPENVDEALRGLRTYCATRLALVRLKQASQSVASGEIRSDLQMVRNIQRIVDTPPGTPFNKRVLAAIKKQILTEDT